MEPEIEQLRELRLWPDVIADLIGGYVVHTLEERIDCATYNKRHKGEDIVDIHGEIRVWHSYETEWRLTLDFDMPGSHSLVSCILKERLAPSIRAGCWLTDKGQVPRHVLDFEMYALNKWLLSITEPMWCEYYARRGD